MYRNLKGLLVKVANNLPYDECLSEAGSFYKDNFRLTKLSIELKMLVTYSSEQNNTTCKIPCSICKVYQVHSDHFIVKFVF